MVELSSSWLCQQHFPLESSAFRNCMIAPVEHRQHEFLPASKNPCRVSANLDLNGFGYSGFPERGLTIEDYGSIQKSVPHSQTPLTQNQYHGEQNPLFPAKDGGGEKPSTCELPSAQQKKFLIFDRSGNETRLIFSSLCPRVENLKTPLTTTCPAWNLPAEESFGACHQYLAEKQGRIIEQAWTKTPALCEESVSSGHSPLAKEIRDCEKQEDQEGEKYFYNQLASLERSSKRQKALHGGFNRMRHSPAYEDVNDGGLIDALSERMCPTIGTKRPRKDKIHDTLRVLEGIIPGLTCKDPLVILDEAISYLKGLKYNAETMSSGDPDSSSSYEPLN
uniref:BHLH domain-containing protein n=1 Tax=Chenopodium quinoa TaxID=63459 RepID=A0A803MCC8_CHEQI